MTGSLHSATRKWIEGQLDLQLEPWEPGDITDDLKIKVLIEQRNMYEILWMNAFDTIKKAMPDYRDKGWIFDEAVKRLKSKAPR